MTGGCASPKIPSTHALISCGLLLKSQRPIRPSASKMAVPSLRIERKRCREVGNRIFEVGPRAGRSSPVEVIAAKECERSKHPNNRNEFDAAVEAAALQIAEAAGGVGQVQGPRELDCGSRVGDGPLPAADAVVGGGASAIGKGIFRILLDHFRVFSNNAVPLAERAEGVDPADVGIRETRIEPDGRVEMSDRLGELALLVAKHSVVVMTNRVKGIGSDRIGVLGDGAIAHLSLDACDSLAKEPGHDPADHSAADGNRELGELALSDHKDSEHEKDGAREQAEDDDHSEDDSGDVRKESAGATAFG